MGVRASVYLISEESYETEVAGDLEGMNTNEFGEALNLDKSWHALHYLITGDSSLNFLGGKQVDGIEDFAKVYSPEFIRGLHIDMLDEKLANVGYESSNNNEVYPQY